MHFGGGGKNMVGLIPQDWKILWVAFGGGGWFMVELTPCWKCWVQRRIVKEGYLFQLGVGRGERRTN